MKKAVPWLLRPAPMGVLGLVTGFLVKMLDIHCYTQHFGVSLSDIFSQAGVWVVIGVAISLYSRDNRTAMANIFLFCAGMLLTYYITAEVTNSIYGWSFIKAWAAFACLSPLMAYLVRLTLPPGALALVLKLGVFAGYVGMNLLLGNWCIGCLGRGGERREKNKKERAPFLELALLLCFWKAYFTMPATSAAKSSWRFSRPSPFSKRV